MGRKYEKKEEVHEDMFNHFKNIFDKTEREKGETISKFLGEIENHPEALAKKLTEAEKEANEKEISLDELRKNTRNRWIGQRLPAKILEPDRTNHLPCPENIHQK